MALSAQTYQGDGVNTDFVLDFTLGYISEDHIYVYEDDVLIDRDTYTFINGGGSVRLATAPADGSQVLVRRIVPNDKLIHDYANGALIIEENIDQSNLQAVMLQHESIDGFISKGAGQNLDMSGFKITNLGEPTEDSDAMTFAASKQAVDDATAQAVISTTQAAASSASATASATSAAEAAASAQIVQHALLPKGLWDPSAGNFPPTPTAGTDGVIRADLWVMSTTGTMDNGTQSVTVHQDDHIYWNTTDNRWDYFVINGVQVSALTGFAEIPVGTTAQRGTGKAGALRFNSEEVEFEGFNGTEWGSIGGGGMPPPVTSDLATTVASKKKNHRIDVSDNVSRTVTLPAGWKVGDFLYLGLGGWTGQAGVTVTFDPDNSYSWDYADIPDGEPFVIYGNQFVAIQVVAENTLSISFAKGEYDDVDAGDVTLHTGNKFNGENITLSQPYSNFKYLDFSVVASFTGKPHRLSGRLRTDILTAHPNDRHLVAYYGGSDAPAENIRVWVDVLSTTELSLVAGQGTVFTAAAVNRVIGVR